MAPNVEVPLGDGALRQVLHGHWPLSVGAMNKWAGQQIPLQKGNYWICPTYSASRSNKPIEILWFNKHIRAAMQLADRRPWKTVPDYKALVERVYDPEMVGKILQEMSDYRGMSAFDYEGNMLKPDSDTTVATSCSIAWGRAKTQRCIAFPIVPQVRQPLIRYLRSPIEKIAANMKFEQRWSVAVFGTKVRNWLWDTMQCAHVLDNTTGVTSLDFQCFVKLGYPPYSSHIKPLLSAGGTVTPNKLLTEISMPQLLTYNGLDSITEFELAVKQMKSLGKRPKWLG